MTTFVIGDLHGYHADYLRLLGAAGLINRQFHWCGGQHRLWLIGDFFDRGPDGLACVETTMRLQIEASRAGGSVAALLGNHEIMLLAVRRFGDSFVDHWLQWGGQADDLNNLKAHHIDWLKRLPAMALVDDSLLLHADAMLYIEHGLTISAVNESFWQLLECDEFRVWSDALQGFGEHMAFCSLAVSGRQRAEQLLAIYGGQHLVHGHTPIPYARQTRPEKVTSAWSYAAGKCINVDGGLYMGGPGFVFALPAAGTPGDSRG